MKLKGLYNLHNKGAFYFTGLFFHQILLGSWRKEKCDCWSTQHTD